MFSYFISIDKDAIEATHDFVKGVLNKKARDKCLSCAISKYEMKGGLNGLRKKEDETF